jgi:hypothetical protein
MELICRRRPTVKDTTLGELWLGNERLCYTLEDAVREIAGRPVSEWKVAGKTAIPAGRYRLTLEHSPRFGADTMTLNLVPGFVGVRVHAGNDDADTEGCPLLGMAITDKEEDGGGIVGGTSRPAVEKVKALVKQAIDCGEEVWWHINPAA